MSDKKTALDMGLEVHERILGENNISAEFVNLHGETFISVSCQSMRKISDELTEDELSKMILDGISEKLKQRIDAGRDKYLRGAIGLLGCDDVAPGNPPCETISGDELIKKINEICAELRAKKS